MVTIVDPHIKHDSGYSVHTDAQAKSVYVKDENGNDFEGWCWPGTSSWVDFTSPTARQWWADRFALDAYKVEHEARTGDGPGAASERLPCSFVRSAYRG